MYLSHIAYQLSPTQVNLTTLVTQGELTAVEAMVFERMMGLKMISRNASSTACLLASAVLKQFFNQPHANKKKIKYVLFAHTADYVAPFEFNILKDLAEAFELSEAICFSSTINKCASAFHLIELAKTLFLSLNDDDEILLLIADNTFTGILKTIPGSTILGDAASLVILKKISHQNRIVDVLIETDGRFASGSYANIEAQLLFQSHYVDKLSATISNVIDRNRLSITEIKYIFPHNVNTISWHQVARRLNIPIQKIFLENVAKAGHCFGSDPFINLTDAISVNLLLSGDFYLLVTVGLGATFSVMLLQY